MDENEKEVMVFNEMEVFHFLESKSKAELQIVQRVRPDDSDMQNHTTASV